MINKGNFIILVYTYAYQKHFMNISTSTQKSVSQQIKNHLIRRGEESVDYITTKQVRYWWNLLNKCVFDEKLPKLQKVHLVKHKLEHAWAIGEDDKNFSLSISPKFASRTLFLSVLVHEMVHAWEHIQDMPFSHGKEFMKWKPIIKQQTSLPLRIRY
jgi:SprT-like family